ncbi:MAG: hypothetical protein GF355_06025, partial [Candidatus Eisenbacteria bacterium]|nr:hypothetical protein [Candidatus Eisenbacteria bacterium]
MSLWKTWYFWLTGSRGAGSQTIPAFHWIRGRVGQRQNADGMRSLIHYGVAFTVVSAVLDAVFIGDLGIRSILVYSAVHFVW